MHVRFQYDNPHASTEPIQKIIVSSPEINNKKDSVYDEKATAIFIHMHGKEKDFGSFINKLKNHFNKCEQHSHTDETVLKIPSVTPKQICDELINDHMIESDFVNKIRAHRSDHVSGDTGSEEDYMTSW